MPQFTAYLTFDGQCADAMAFYQRTLGGELQSHRMGDSPMAGDLPKAYHDRLMHASLALDGGVLMASDTMPGMPYDGMKGFAISLQYRDAEQGRRIFDALAAGGTVTMPYAPTFWAAGFGMLVDRYGTPWMVNVDTSPA